ncbi:MAG: C40 family peptidase [Acidobacteria bacterium]|nr:C40 family peptidase [Acidobacteriota bacterium]
MKKAFRMLLCLSLLVTIWTQTRVRAEAQETDGPFTHVAKDAGPSPFTLPRITTTDFTPLVFPSSRRDPFLPPLIFIRDPAVSLQDAIAKRLGIRYRFHGTDDRGYDCSGFVWRVFQDAGAEFDRVAARILWRQLPEVSGEESRQFGTLVFFRGLRHVGIVRDANSFYHASRRNGVKLSFFNGYWERRITGYRRAPLVVEFQTQ